MSLERDPNRPLYLRPPGQLGVCLDVVDAQARDPKEFGSERFFELQLMDVLLEDFTDRLHLYQLKGQFEDRRLLDGVIFQKFYRGIILSISFDTEDGLEGLWNMYESGQLPALLQQFLITPEVLKRTKARKIQLRTRMYQDEFNLCKAELLACTVPQISLQTEDYDLAMIRKVKEFQNSMPDIVTSLRDALSDFDENMSEFLMHLKRNIPLKVEVIRNYNELDKIFKILKGKRGLNLGPCEHYESLYKQLPRTLRDLEVQICHPLAQVHAACESSSQHEIKRKIKKLLVDTRRLLTPEYDFTTCKHPEWLHKIMLKEQKLFSGVVSVLPLAVDAVIDIDSQVDEYLSGVQVKHL